MQKEDVKNMTNSERLLNYCEKNLVHKENFYTYMEEYPNFIFQLLNASLLNITGKQIIESQRRLLALQKIKSVFYEKEIQTFISSKIPFVGIKGYFIEKVYYPPEYTRLYGDIDILVSDNDGKSFYNMLISNNYNILKAKDSPLNFKKKLFIDKILLCFGSTFFKYRHHAELEKPTSFPNSDVVLDLHGNLFLTQNSPKKSMIANSITKTIGSNTFKIFSPEDNILFLMYHTIKHVGYVNLARENLGINLGNFYDVAQIITLEKIDWKRFITRATEYSYFIPMVALFMKIFNDIFPNKIPSQIIDDINKLALKMNFHWKVIYNNAIKMSSSDLIMGNYQSITWLHKHCVNVSLKQINPEYIWIFWAWFYFKMNFSKKYREEKRIKNA